MWVAITVRSFSSARHALKGACKPQSIQSAKRAYSVGLFGVTPAISHLRGITPARRWYESDVSEGTQQMNEPLPYKELPYRGAEIDCGKLMVADSAEFGTRLFMTIMEAKEKGVGAMYLKVDMIHSHYIPIAATFGFTYHHAEGQEAVLMRWLPDSECKVPPSATHHVGVGALIVTDDGELLCVKEKHKLAGWKLPGGYVNLGEDLGVAAEREVMEETGVKCEFESLVRLRHSHQVQGDRSDIYVITKMRALSREITLDDEISEAKWMKVEDFIAQNTHPMHAEIMEHLHADREGFSTTGWGEVKMPSTIPHKPAFAFYSPKQITTTDKK